MVSAVGFLEPGFLWALAFLGGVLLIHFLKLPAALKLDFSTLRFFDKSAITANRSQRLRRLLLLLVRLLLVAVIVLLFARPFPKNDALHCIRDPQFDLFVWVDRTPSMEYRENGVTAGEKAMRIVDSVFAARKSAGVFLYNHDLEEFTAFDKSRGQPFSIRYAFSIAPLRQACERALTGSKRPAFLILSDFQSTTADALDTIRRSGAFGKAPLVGCRLTPKKPWNAAVSEASAGSGQDAVITACVRTFGARGFAGSCVAKIDHIRSGAVPCTLGVQTDTVITVITRRAGGEGWGSVELQGDDPCAFDNISHFVAGRGAGFSVLIVGDEAVNFPVAAALRTSKEKRWEPVVIRAPEALDFSTADSADLVIVNGYRSAARALELLEKGRGPRLQAFIVAAGGNDTSAGAETHLLRFLSISGIHAKALHPLNILLPDTVSSLWRGFPSLQVAQARVYSFFDGLKGTPLLMLTNNKPLAVMAVDVFGRPWIVLATPLGITQANNLCETGFYVPFIDRLARHACSELDRRKDVWIAGSAIKNPWYGSRLPARVLGMDQSLIFQLQQQPVFVVESPGVYKIVPPSAAPYLQVVVPDTLESRLNYRTPENKGQGAAHWAMVSHRQMLSYLNEHGQAFGWLIPWLVLGMLLFAELLLRENRRG